MSMFWQLIRKQQCLQRKTSLCTDYEPLIHNISTNNQDWSSPSFLDHLQYPYKPLTSIISELQKWTYHGCALSTREMFDIETGVRQGCILSPFLFLIFIDVIMTKAMDDASFGIEWGQNRLANLDFADDISAISHTVAGILEITNNIETLGANIGLRINCEKNKAMKIGPEQHPPTLTMQQNVDYVEKCPYLARQDRKSCIHFPTASFYMVINYHQLECQVTHVHSHCDPHSN